eukprot:scaffold10560_cov133-Isochrysis_galbana.AAC.12
MTRSWACGASMDIIAVSAEARWTPCPTPANAFKNCEGGLLIASLHNAWLVCAKQLKAKRAIV